MTVSTHREKSSDGQRDAVVYSSVGALETHIRHLQEEREQLQIRIEELRAANEELRATNLSLHRRLDAAEAHDRQLALENRALRRESSRLHELTEAADIGLLFVDDNLEVTRFTPLAAELFNLRSTDYGRPLTELHHNLDWDDLHDQIRRVMDTGRSVEETVRDASGDRYRLRIFPYSSSSEDTDGAVLSVTCHTKHRQAFDLLEELREILELAREGEGLGLWKIDLDDRQVFLDGRARRMLGIRSKQSVSLAQILSLVPPEDKQRTLRAFREAARPQSNGTYEVEHRILRLPEDERWIHLRAQVLFETGSDGRRPARMLGVVRDITEQKQIVQALRESERKFRQLAEQSLLGIALLQDGGFKYVNPRAAELFGRAPERIVGGTQFEELVVSEDWTAVETYLRDCTSNDHAGGQECRLRGSDGETVEVEIFCSPITSRGRPALLCYLLDLSERRRLERELLDVQEAERRELGRELHDSVASQLTGVALILSSYATAAEDGDRSVTAADLRRVKEMVREAGEQTRQLSHGLHPGRVEGADLIQALDELVESLALTFEGRCRFDNQCDRVNLDQETSTHLYRLAQEAVTNAVKHSGARTVHVHLQRESGDLILAVDDDGEGFEVDTTSPGIGLKSMRYRARMIGGQLSIQSNPGEGTTIQCRVPTAVRS